MVVQRVGVRLSSGATTKLKTLAKNPKNEHSNEVA